MADLTVSCLIGTLEVNDRINYSLSNDNLLGGSIEYNRIAATSPFFDGDVLISKNFLPVEDTLTVYVKGSSMSAVSSNLGALMTALDAANWTLTLTVDSTVFSWLCDTKSRKVSWDNSHFVNKVIAVQVDFIRQPLPVSGPI